MTVRSPKPPILRSKRGVALLLAAIVAVVVILYVGVGATAFLRTSLQDEPSAPTQGAADRNDGAPAHDRDRP